MAGSFSTKVAYAHDSLADRFQHLRDLCLVRASEVQGIALVDRDYDKLGHCFRRVFGCRLNRIGHESLVIHSGSSRNHADTWRGRRVETRGKQAYSTGVRCLTERQASQPLAQSSSQILALGRFADRVVR